MTFEEAMSALGSELGFDLAVEDGKASLEVVDAEGNDAAVVVELSEMRDGRGVLLSCDVGEVPSAGGLKQLLEANHMFGETSGATLSAEDGRLYFERYVPISVIGRGEGAEFVKMFVAEAKERRRRLEGRAEPRDSSLPPISPAFMQV